LGQRSHLESGQLGPAKALFSLGTARSMKACILIGRNWLAAHRRWTGNGAGSLSDLGRPGQSLSDLSQNPSASGSASFESPARYTTASSPRPIPSASAGTGRPQLRGPYMLNAVRALSRDQDHCRALQSVFSCKFLRADRQSLGLADVSMQSCLMGAPQLADWMKYHPAERLAAWRRVIGEQDGRGALG